jgi:hypothetical protein
MIVQRIVRDEADTVDLVETSSTEGFKLRQIETGKIYGSIVVDAIPLRYSYEETDEPDETDGAIEVSGTANVWAGPTQ